MKPRIRKLNIETDKESLEQYSEKTVFAKIILDELQTSNDEGVIYEAYGVFTAYNTLIGFCSVSNYLEYDAFEYFDENSKGISEMYIEDYSDEYYSNKLELCCDLLSYVLNDESNKDSNIFFDNNININDTMAEQLGFITLDEGVLVRLSDKYKTENNL